MSGYPHDRGEACDCSRCMEIEQERLRYEDEHPDPVQGDTDAIAQAILRADPWSDRGKKAAEAVLPFIEAARQQGIAEGRQQIMVGDGWQEELAAARQRGRDEGYASGKADGQGAGYADAMRQHGAVRKALVAIDALGKPEATDA